jgi:hypothetical protein
MKLPPLYKYLDQRGAELTLGNRTFKFARPSDFNDSKDLTVQSIFPEEVDVAVAKIANSFTDVILENLNKPPTCRKEWRPKLALLQLMYRLNPAAAEVTAVSGWRHIRTGLRGNATGLWTPPYPNFGY